MGSPVDCPACRILVPTGTTATLVSIYLAKKEGNSQVKNQIEINLVRLSIIWIETNLRLLGDPSPPNLPLGFLGNRNSYITAFDKVMQKQTPPIGLEAPWPSEESGQDQHFWKYYLESKPKLGYMPGDKAWKFLVPFRGRVAVKKVTALSLDEQTGKFRLESFFYPFGFGLIITFEARNSWSLAETVDLVFNVSRKSELDVQWESGPEGRLYFKQFADRCLTSIRQVALGQTGPAGIIPDQPFTIFTVLKGSGENLEAPLTEGEEIHRMLEAVTSWAANWPKARLPALDEKVKLPLKSSTNDADVVYARKRGRAVWFPTLFTDSELVRRSLSCYHRNLVFAALQTESLCGLATATEQEIEVRTFARLPVMHRDCAELAAKILGRMYAGHKDTYRSMSLRYHIQQNGLEAAINKIRDEFNLIPLH